MKRKILISITDIILAALIVLGVWIYNYKIPRNGISAAEVQSYYNDTVLDTNINTEIQTYSNNKNNVNTVESLGLKFSNKFSNKVTCSESSYKSSDISIKISYHSYDSGKIDTSENGKHKKYGTKVAYVLADIYVSDISCIKTAFAQDTYGVGYEEHIKDMSDRLNAILAINGDSYNNNLHKNNGTIIRNGVLYRNASTDAETCVLYKDGSMKIYDPGKLDGKKLIDDGAWQSFVFGPSLLDKNGKAKKDFVTWDYIKESHPRTAIGYYEPGHYCLLLADGRQKDYSRGMFPEEMAKVFEDLGCKAAYNLDGGHSSSMLLDGNVISHPYKPSKTISDGIFITEGNNK